MTAAACIGEPVSWPRLERFAADRADAAIEAHLAACPVCARCLAQLRADVVVLRPLAVPAAAAVAPRRRWWLIAAPALAAAAVLALLLLRRGDPPIDEPRGNVVAVKGVGEVVLGVVRERDGVIREDVLTYAPGDRWKLVVTCPPRASAGIWVDLAVLDAGQVDHPLPPASITCGNRVVLPGAFELAGDRPNLVCVRVGPDAARDRPAPRPGDPDVACVTIRPE